MHGRRKATGHTQKKSIQNPHTHTWTHDRLTTGWTIHLAENWGKDGKQNPHSLLQEKGRERPGKLLTQQLKGNKPSFLKGKEIVL